MIGHVLKAFRDTHRMSMREFAKRQGWSVATQCRIESGKPMDQRVMLRLIGWLFEPNTPTKTVERWFTSYNSASPKWRKVSVVKIL